MREPLRNFDVRARVDDICPKCHSNDITVTINPDNGVYCRCPNCGHIWHQDRATH
jgi:uncharacterized Zn finger protein